MSKVSFRAKALDASKPMPVYKAQEIPDIKDFAQINRSVPQMPTGMEKEEETEHHLQRALSAQQVYGSSEALVIPIPEVQDIEERYDDLYKSDFKPTKQYIHIQAFNMDQEIPDYDMDSDDDTWLGEQSKKMEMTPIKFEQMIDRLEKGSGQQVVTLQEAKLLLKEDDDLIMAVYDYWLNKRLKLTRPLTASVKSEKRDGTTNNNPYVAFRRRIEKMITRRNRKTDEISYEKMLKLRRDLQKALTLLELLKRREKSKKELLQLTIEVLEKRNEMEDFSGAALAEAEEERDKHPTFVAPFALNCRGEWVQTIKGEESAPVRKKRQYRKRKQSQQQLHTPNQSIPHLSVPHFPPSQPSSSIGDVDVMYSSDEDILSPALSQSDHEDENDPDGMFAFKRRKHCHYYQPIQSGQGNWPWCGPDSGGKGDPRFRFSLTSISSGCVGYARRRVGRGGRIIFDRVPSEWDNHLDRLNFSTDFPASSIQSEYITYVREKKIPHYRSKTPPSDDSDDEQNPPNRRGFFHPSQRGDAPGFDVESFQCHREQLLEMQREQQQKLLTEDGNRLAASVPIDLEASFTSADLNSRFTLDSASAEFAVRALVESPKLDSSALEATTASTINVTSAADPIGSRTTTQHKYSLVSGAISSLNNFSVSKDGKSFTNSVPSVHLLQTEGVKSLKSSLTSNSSSLHSSVSNSSSSNLQKSTSTSIIPILVSSSNSSAASSSSLSSAATILLSQSLKTNGPSSALVKSSGLSTSPAANVLQLNFPASLNNNNTSSAPASNSNIIVTPISSLSSSSSSSSSAPNSSSLNVVAIAPSASTAISTLPVSSNASALQLQRTYSSKHASPSTAPSGHLYRLPVAASPANFDILKSNHEDSTVILFNKETGIPMDVT